MQAVRGRDLPRSVSFRSPLHSRRLVPLRSSRIPSQQLSTGSIILASDLRWGSYVSNLPILELAAKEAVDTILASIGKDSRPQLAIVFVTSALGSEFDQVVPIIRELVPSLKHIIGCSGYGVIGGGSEGPNEIEGEPGFSLSLGQLPDTDIHVMHTLRSSIPEPDATRQAWSDWVGVPYDTQKEVSFMMLADPRFSQVEQMVEGLDNAFPESKKIGGILSTASRPRSRALFAWNSNEALIARKEMIELEKKEMQRRKGRRGPNGKASSSQKMRKRISRQSQSPDAVSKKGPELQEMKVPNEQEEVQVKESKKESDKADGSVKIEEQKKSVGGFLGTIMRMLTGGDKKKAQTVQGLVPDSRQVSPSLIKGEATLRPRGFGGDKPASIEPSSSSSSSSEPSCMFLHGAVMLVLHGNVKMDTITSMGYRSPSDRLFKVESLGRPHEIVTVAADLTSDGARDRSSSTTSQFIQLMSQDLGVGGSDSDSEDEGRMGGNEIQAVIAVVDMIEGLGDEFEGNLDELLDTAMLAVARDSGKTPEELQPEDFELIPLEAINEEYGVLVVSPSEQLRKGDRFKIMVRDNKALKEDLRDKILAYKKKELLAMMMFPSSCSDQDTAKDGGSLTESSRPLPPSPPPTFGVLMFTDMDRGMSLYEEESFEARMLSSYLPAPTSGLLAGGQIAPFNGDASHKVMENVCVAGILRALPSPPPANPSSMGPMHRARLARLAEDDIVEMEVPEEITLLSSQDEDEDEGGGDEEEDEEEEGERDGNNKSDVFYPRRKSL